MGDRSTNLQFIVTTIFTQEMIIAATTISVSNLVDEILPERGFIER
ncbi:MULTISPECIES: hypothetical protein [Nostoc]|uniref:Uncharacterized protein n=1 Tax=Nostoc paludosum FACHB-159 TaxID=2692908 RepID=A0ABR8KHD3_9NOSO|nr:MULTISPECIES: hypothetical protein [Nostoc]MBD2681237.1 hypothetical protein [Nostoc sp. FACHB-857]MBD2737715.1 hypothetical protein [Nostoc paludosum FACHB-159]